jgi:hypothetical protein
MGVAVNARGVAANTCKVSGGYAQSMIKCRLLSVVGDPHK